MTTSFLNRGESPSALGHLRVLDMAGHSGQYCSKLLADMGADVIKVEPPGGDPVRYLAPFAGDIRHVERSLRFIGLNASKRSVVLDMASGADRDTLRRLVATADVLVETFAPGHLDSLGLGYRRLSEINPGLVYTSITSFGQNGPYKDYAGSEIVAQAMGGLMYIQGDDNKPPCVCPCDQAYHLASIHAAFATLMALSHRRRTGLGQCVDVSIQEVMASLLFTIAKYANSFEIARRVGSAPPMNSTNHFQCKDGRVTMAVYFNRHWRAFVQWMGNDLLISPIWEDTNFRVANADVIDPCMTEFAQRFTQKELIEEGQKRHLAVVPLNTIADFVASPQTKARHFFVASNHPILGEVQVPGAPYRFSETPWRLQRPAPLLGQHQKEVLDELERASSTSKGMKQRGVKPSRSRGEMPLQGVRVLDFSRVWSGPFTTRFLADFGAEVIRIETRDFLDTGRLLAGPNTQFPEINRNKLGVTLNFDSSEGSQLIKDLVRISDIVIENFSLGVLERRGLGYQELKKVKPDIIMMGMPALGSWGPHADYLAYGVQIMSYIGLADIWGHSDSPFNARSKVHYPDFVSAATATVALLMALEHRARTGRGQYIELAQTEAVVATMEVAFMDHLINGHTWGPAGNRDMNFCPHGCYPCRGDDAWCVIACSTEDEWQRLSDVMGNPSWASNEKFATKEERLQHQDELDEHIGRWTRDFTPMQVMRILQSAGVAAGAVQTGEDLYRDIHLRDRGYVLEVKHPGVGRREHSGMTARLSLTPGRVQRGAPTIGLHNRRVFKDMLGLSEKQFRGLVKSGVIA